MKKFKKHISLLFFVCIAFSCSEEKLIDKIYSDTTTGIVIRTLTDPDTISFDIFDTSPTWDMEVEIQDKENGSTLSEVRLYFTFIDNNDDPSDDTSTEALVATYPASHFSTPGEFGLPTGVLSLSYAEALSTAGITVADVLPGDTFFYRVEAELTDGRVFTNDANGTVSGGTFFTSPFQYSESLEDGIEFEVADENRNVVDVTEGATNDDFLFTVSIDMSDPAFAEADYIESVTVYRSFSDRNILEGEEDMSEPEAVFRTFPLTDFTDTDGVMTLEYGFPQTELYGPDLAFEDLLPNDQFRLRYEILTTDGRLITTTEAGTEYYLTYDVFECVQLNADAPYPGEYTFDMKDAYEDDWNGGYLTVVLDGVALEDTFAAVGAGSTGSFTVPEGTTTFEFFYTSGDWDEENTWILYDPNGNPAASGGPYPNGNGLPPAEYPGGEILVCE
ncbi:hypothetical protein F8C76_08975 [Flagellimonas olearia]|uniref:Uncharacterized protein n=1 Tax=Flagellimonas olearia TaxID=552546 RepID=A0A6I1E1R2_9FLAO|nr:hypothetical protein [Allomuricauda olearia]KAB7531608.1 hypothetical protein F8C76_08975 [Allomuricauda olearia]